MSSSDIREERGSLCWTPLMGCSARVLGAGWIALLASCSESSAALVLGGVAGLCSVESSALFYPPCCVLATCLD